MIRLTLRGGVTYTGRTIDTIIRREFGPRAFFRPSANRESPEGGVILEPVPYDNTGVFNILADVLTIEEANQ
ncbi:MAG TPA: hypothetical protein VJY40_08755 [Corynebacterium sp.]|nr:hypothetical protein [Corynebacterium sp.]